MKTVSCLTCEAEFQTEDTYTPHIQGHEFSVCPACRRHIAIGRAVEGMPNDSRLYKAFDDEWALQSRLYEYNWHRTPLEALKGGKK